MAARYISIPDTAKLIRAALKEAFKGVKFGVTSNQYSGGGTVSVTWIDGPCEALVETITKKFQGSYFDSGIDFKGSVGHMMRGEPVRFMADSVHLNRRNTPEAIGRAIERFARKFAGNLSRDGIAKPTVEQFQSGDLLMIRPPGVHHDFSKSVQSEIRQILAKDSDRIAAGRSTTAESVFVTHDDGYGRSAAGTGGGSDLLDGLRPAEANQVPAK